MTDSDVYNDLCTSYRAIDEFRAHLLGFLPLATAGGGGVFALTGGKQKLLEPVAIFGVFITIGLYAYELYGITKCHYLIKTGEYLERQAHIPGQFATRPGPALRALNEPFAAAVIYPAVVAAWTFMAVHGPHWVAALIVAIVVFLGGFSMTMMYSRSLDARWLKDHPELK